MINIVQRTRVLSFPEYKISLQGSIKLFTLKHWGLNKKTEMSQMIFSISLKVIISIIKGGVVCTYGVIWPPLCFRWHDGAWLGSRLWIAITYTWKLFFSVRNIYISGRRSYQWFPAITTNGIDWVDGNCQVQLQRDCRRKLVKLFC